MNQPPPGTTPMRLLIADDESLLLSTLAQILDLQDGIDVVARARSGAEAIDLARRLLPDVALVDLEMPTPDGPSLDGIDVITAIAEVGVRGVIVTRHARPTLLRRALAAGAAGFVHKSTSSEVLTDILRQVHAGGRYVDAEVAALAMTATDCPLADRELEILALVRANLTTRDIAEHLHLAQGTVRNYISSSLTKLGVDSGRAAADRAWTEGWI